jgi:organic hydroperoxide reductase OsmC/OhrA
VDGSPARWLRKKAFILAGSGLPVAVSGELQKKTRPIVQASIAFFGTYIMYEAAKTLTLHIESCSLFRSPPETNPEQLFAAG